MNSRQELISIILPTFNERDNVRPIINELLKIEKNSRLEIIVVDDDSPDGTAEKVRDRAHTQTKIRLIRRVGRSGLAITIKEGLVYAIGDIAVSMDVMANTNPPPCGMHPRPNQSKQRLDHWKPIPSTSMYQGIKYEQRNRVQSCE